jgi:hypothetical protein
MQGSAKASCHTLTLIFGTSNNVLTASKPAGRRFYCILPAKDLKMKALFLACAVGHQFGAFISLLLPNSTSFQASLSRVSLRRSPLFRTGWSSVRVGTEIFLFRKDP